MKRYVKEYANDILRRKDLTEENKKRIEKILNLYSRYLVTTSEVMYILATIDREN